MHGLVRGSVAGIGAALFCVLCGRPVTSAADDPAAGPDLSGTWVLNLELSDDPDRQIEKSIRAAGGRPDSGGRRGRERYRGGPADQEIYDHLIYDGTVRIVQNGAEVHIAYGSGFERRFFTDGRSRTVSASGSGSGDGLDFSFGAWSGPTLHVEAKPRDGGWTRESYTLEPGGNRLRAEMEMKPLLFPAVVQVRLIYDRGPVRR
ncbi:MAG: hypothetical protein HYR49_02150 [Gammaproteobacteria bacterium]|nr:hypothetical protein [Gammaproteobacteria bacterium]